MKKFIIWVSILLLLCGCENRKCIKSHNETKKCVTYTYVYTGKVMMPIPHYYNCEVTVCDEYEKENKNGKD